MSQTPEEPGTQPSVSSIQAEVESRLTDFHYAIFDLLPDEGKMFGWTQMVISTRLLRDQLNGMLPKGAPKLSSGQVMAELRTLASYGLVEKVESLGGSTQGYQRKPRAIELLAERKRHAEAADRARKTREGEGTI